MSKYYPDIPNDDKSAGKYIKYLLSLSCVKDVYIGGSRSPLTKKVANKNSDWDLFVTPKVNRIFISSPRKLKVLNADVHQGEKVPQQYVHYTEVLKYRKLTEESP